MQRATIFSFVLANRVSQVHGATADGQVAFREKLPLDQGRWYSLPQSDRPKIEPKRLQQNAVDWPFAFSVCLEDLIGRVTLLEGCCRSGPCV